MRHKANLKRVSWFGVDRDEHAKVGGCQEAPD
jgi:hypothetical protein